MADVARRNGTVARSVRVRGPSVTVAGVRIDALRFETVVERILDQAINSTEPAFVITPNAHHVVMFQDDALLRAIYGRAALVVPDGVPLLWSARLLGSKLPGRVNGTDLFEALCAESAQRGLRVFLLGGRYGAADAAAARLCKQHPKLTICGTYCPPYGFEQDAAEVEKAVAAVSEASPHILFVGLGAPKQEHWMYFQSPRTGVPVSVGIGVSFEFVGGMLPRAPRWMQRLGLEWLYRLCSEPGRLWRRYLIGNLRFCTLVFRELSRRPRAPQPAFPQPAGDAAATIPT